MKPEEKIRNAIDAYDKAVEVKNKAEKIHGEAISALQNAEANVENKWGDILRVLKNSSPKTKVYYKGCTYWVDSTGDLVRSKERVLVLEECQSSEPKVAAATAT